MKRIFGLLVVMTGLVIISGCQKEDLLNLTDEEALLKSAQMALTDDKLEMALTEVEYESFFYSGIEKLLLKMHFGKVKQGYLDFQHYKMGKGPEIAIDPADETYPKTITLDYGDGTVVHHGRVLKGVVIIEISAAPLTDGATRKITYNDFAVDTITVNGTSVSVFTGEVKTSARENYTQDVVFTYANGTEITWKGEKQRKWAEGISTDMIRLDDVFEITGKVTATIKGGSSYVKEITVPLVRKASCMYIVSGVIQLTVDQTLVASLDYGTGDCDATATLTKDGTTTTLDLTKNKPPFRPGKK